MPAKASITHQFLPSNLMYGLKSSKLRSGVCGFFAILRENKEALHAMNKSTFWTLFAAMILWTMPFDGAGQYISNGACCDPDAQFIAGFQCAVQGEGQGEPLDGVVCDPDCGDYDAANCTTIPLDGGLGLLALAGGGLATAAMRRRREEEAEQQA
jgi:hypothetical protein